MTGLLAAHSGQGGSHAVVDAHEINVHHFLHIGTCELVDKATTPNASTRHDQIEMSECCNCFLHEGLYLLFISHIGWKAQYFTLCIRGRLAYLFLGLLQ